MTETLIILAAGRSSRMKQSEIVEGLKSEAVQEAVNKTKTLIGVGKDSRPLLDFILLNASKAGIRQVILVVGSNREDFENYYGNAPANNEWNKINISYAEQIVPPSRSKPLGTADAVYQALEQYPEIKKGTYMVCNSDNLYSVAAFQALANSPNEQAMIAYDRDALDHSLDRISKFALCRMDNDGFLIEIEEKPSHDRIQEYADSHGKLRVSMNLWKLSGKALTFLRDCPVHPQRDEKELPRAILNMIHAKAGSVFCIPASEHVPDLTTKADILKLNSFLKKE